DVPLVLRAVAGHPTGPDLAAVGDELPQQVRVLVVDVGVLLLAEGAHLLLRLTCRRLGHGRRTPGGSDCVEAVRERKLGSEGRLVGHAARRRGGPGVVPAAAGGAATAEAAAAATTAAAAALTFVDLRGG